MTEEIRSEETAKIRKGPNQKLKMLYLAEILSEETDDRHSLTIQEITEKLAALGVNTSSCRSSNFLWTPSSPPSSSRTASPPT